ncbi:MAG TPA: acyl-CoA dehydrogenase family protein, partial [Actinomycetota bacterium]|nr:acyl-CoA dehydrogenase family protein [Actinomycetota bacterium]
MDLRDSESERRFRSDLRSWLAEVVPTLPSKPDDDDWEGRRRFDTAWQRMLFDAGYAGIDWPVDVGGRGASPAEQLIFLEETQAAGAPYVGVNFVGLLHAGPTIATEGTADQKARHLPPILRGDEVWCQGFSEPGAGSDLAALSTKAVRDGDHYVVNGQKIWTSFAHVADFCELLVRTDPDAPKHRGITWLILPMSTPGIEIRPLRTIAGSSEFSEVFLTNVRVPAENRVGEENDGWRVAMVTFSFERGTAFVVELAQTMALLRDLAELAKLTPRGDGTAWDDPGIRRELGHLLAEVDALWALTKRHVSQAASGSGPGFGVSVSKLRYSEVRHQMGDLALRILGRAAGSLDDMADLPVGEHLRGWLYAMSISIAAGSS